MKCDALRMAEVKAGEELTPDHLRFKKLLGKLLARSMVVQDCNVLIYYSTVDEVFSILKTEDL